MSRLSDAFDQMVLVRRFTNEMLATIPESDWFHMPPQGVTHVAWQVGHLAMAEFKLMLERQRGSQRGDEQLITPAFLAAFARMSVVDPDPAKYPSLAEIRATFDRVHERVLVEVPTYLDSDLDAPLTVSHRICKTRIDFLRWCSAHEMSHAGQIGLLRRLFGHAPIW